MAFALRTRLAYLNKRNEKIMAEMSEEDKSQMSEDIPDTDPRYRFMT